MKLKPNKYLVIGAITFAISILPVSVWLNDLWQAKRDIATNKKKQIISTHLIALAHYMALERGRGANLLAGNTAFLPDFEQAKKQVDATVNTLKQLDNDSQNSNFKPFFANFNKQLNKIKHLREKLAAKEISSDAWLQGWTAAITGQIFQMRETVIFPTTQLETIRYIENVLISNFAEYCELTGRVRALISRTISSHLPFNASDLTLIADFRNISGRIIHAMEVVFRINFLPAGFEERLDTFKAQNSSLNKLIDNVVQSSQTYTQKNITNPTTRIEKVSAAFFDFVEVKIQQELSALVTSPLFQQYLSTGKGPTSPHKHRLTQLLSDYILLSPSIIDIRFIDTTGQEQLKVEKRQDDIIITPDNALQNKSHRYYFKETMQLANAQAIYSSPIDLKNAQKKIVTPLTPTIRYAKLVWHQGKKQGIIVVSLAINSLLHLYQVDLIINEQGYYVHHHNIKKEWGRAKGLNRTQNNIKYDFPAPFTDQILGKVALVVHGPHIYFSLPLYLPYLTKHYYVLIQANERLQYPLDGKQWFDLASATIDEAFSLISFSQVFVQNFLDNHQTAINWKTMMLWVIILGIFILIVALVNIFIRGDKKEEKQRSLNMHTSKMASLGELSAGIAHEINNPLAVISMATNRIKKLALKDALAQKFLTQIETMTTRITAIILSLKKLSRNSDQEAYAPEDIAEVIEDVLTVTRHQLQQSDIKLDVAFNPRANNRIIIACCRGQISQVLVNLLNNAVDAVVGESDKWIKIRVEELETEVRIGVSDSGRGILIGQSERVFEPFYTSKPLGQGTGLGLSISYEIIKSHHGQFYLDKECPHTCFVMLLPQNQPQNAPATILDLKTANTQRFSSTRGEAITHQSILIVDDEEDLREMMMEEIESILVNCTVYGADNGNAAFEIIQNQPIDLVITDVKMPGSSGIELLEKVRKTHPHWPKIILISGDLDLSNDVIRQKGAVALFAKPVDISALMDMAMDILETE